MPQPQNRTTVDTRAKTARDLHPAGGGRPKALRNILRDTPAVDAAARYAKEQAEHQNAIDAWIGDDE